MSAGSNELIPGLPLSREQALALPGMQRYRLVEFLVRWEHFGAARDLLESLVARRAGRFFYQYRLAQCCLATGEVERAKTLARALHAAPETRPVGLLAIGDVFYVEGRLNRAEEQYRQAQEIEKTRESAERRLAWCLLHRRNLDGAAALARQISEGKRPGQLPPAAVRLLAAVAAATGNADEAAALRRELKSRWRLELACLRAALELAPDPEAPFEAAAGLEPVALEDSTRRTRRHGEGSGEEGEQSGTAERLMGGSEATAPGVPEGQSNLARAFMPGEPEPASPCPGGTAESFQALLATHPEENQPPGPTPAAPETPLPSTPTPPPAPPSPTGYVYPTARERQAAARKDTPRQRDGMRDGGAGISPGTPSPGMARGGEEVEGPRPDCFPASEKNDVEPSHSKEAWPLRSDGSLVAALTELFGYRQFRPGQEEVVQHVLEGRSVLAVMPTGRGKSLCFQLPAMLLPRVTIVISPLIALMQDQLAGLPAPVRERATVLNSSLESIEVERRLGELAAGKYRLVYAAPERLRQQPFLHALRRAGVSLLVVDEAHCISLWGQEFRPDYLFLPRVHAGLGQPPLLAMTATAPPVIQEEIRTQFCVPMEVVSQGVFRPNLRLEVHRPPNRSAKLKALQERCRAEPGAMIVYVNARARAEHIAQALNEAGVSAGFYHAGLPHNVREQTQQRFMRDELRCLVATIAFGMGVDKPDIRLILHHDPSRSLESYYQEAGRAGRDGQPARCILFATAGDRAQLSRWARDERLTPDDVFRVHRALLVPRGDQTIAADDLERETGLDDTAVRVAISVLERAGALTRQFDLPRVCTLRVLSPGDGPFQQFVAAVRLRPGQRVTRDTGELCAQSGLSPDMIEAHLMDWVAAGWLEYRGSARGLRLEATPVGDLGARVRELLQRVEAVDEARLGRLEDYLHTTECRHAFLSAYFGHSLTHPTDGEATGCGACDNCHDGRPREDLSATVRFERLREWRRGAARAAELPACRIFPDRALWAMARLQPQSMAELRLVPGIGTRRADQYGEAVLAVLRDVR